MDLNEYTILPMSMYNTFRCCPQDQDETLPQYANCEPSPMMARLIRELSRQRPAWKFYFVGIGEARSDGGYYVSRFHVFEDGEELGDIGKTYTRGGGDSYQMKNKRVFMSLQKRPYEGRITNDLKKAVKTVLQYFYASTVPEISAEARSRVTSVTGMQFNSASYAIRNNVDNLRDAMLQFIKDNWERFAQMPLDMSIARHRDVLLDNFDRHTAARVLHEAHNKREGIIVQLRDDKYWVMTPGSEEFTPRLDADKVPDHIKAGVGMLKLVNSEQSIPDVGVRIAADLFFILNKEPSQ